MGGLLYLCSFDQGVPCKMVYVEAGGYTENLLGARAIHVCRTFQIGRCTAEFAGLHQEPSLHSIFCQVAESYNAIFLSFLPAPLTSNTRKD